MSNVLRPADGQGDAIGAMTLFDDHLYVVRQLPAHSVTRFVTVYDTKSMSVVRTVSVPRLGLSSFGLAVCPSGSTDYLFVSDFHQSFVHRVEVDRAAATRRPTDNDESSVFCWPVASHPVGLTMTRCGHLLVTCSWANVLQLYDAVDGRLLRETPFSIRDRRNPEYSVELPPTADGKDPLYVVSHKGPVNGVCVVRAVDGVAVFCYGGIRSTMKTSLKQPRALAIVARSRCVLVADKGNNRVVVIDEKMKRARVLPLQLVDDEHGGLLEPQSLCIDPDRNRLYIGEFQGSSRLVIIDNINNVEINE